MPPLLKALGVVHIEELYCEPNGHFPHNPEPLPEHLGQICGVMEKGQFDLGIVVDPDVALVASVVDVPSVVSGSSSQSTPTHTISHVLI